MLALLALRRADGREQNGLDDIRLRVVLSIDRWRKNGPTEGVPGAH
jgi:hypothetical protein